MSAVAGNFLVNCVLGTDLFIPSKEHLGQFPTLASAEACLCLAWWPFVPEEDGFLTCPLNAFAHALEWTAQWGPSCEHSQMLFS